MVCATLCGRPHYTPQISDCVPRPKEAKVRLKKTENLCHRRYLPAKVRADDTYVNLGIIEDIRGRIDLLPGEINNNTPKPEIVCCVRKLSREG
jgi:hypothetical protein